MNEQFHYAGLLMSYLSLWNNRNYKETSNGEAKDILHELIKRELLDENAHPRIRKTIKDKYSIGIKRIADSSLQKEEIVSLISVYTKIYQSLKLLESNNQY